jgi:hypothetical protein
MKKERNLNIGESSGLRYEKPEMTVHVMSARQTMLAGSDPAKVQDYEDGDDYSYIPNDKNIVNKA